MKRTSIGTRLPSSPRVMLRVFIVSNILSRMRCSVVEQESSLLVAAGRRRPGLSYYDHVCLLAAKAAGWMTAASFCYLATAQRDDAFLR